MLHDLQKYFSGCDAMNISSGFDQRPAAYEGSKEAATKFKWKLLTDMEMETLPTMELSYLVEENQFKIY